MDTSKIIQFRLFKNEHKKLPPNSHYNLIYVDSENYLQYINELTLVTSYIHKQLTEWTDAPTMEQVHKRFSNNSFCFLFYYNDNCIGWNWANPHVTPDWINIHTKLKSDEVYLGGCFVTNLIDRPANAGIMNYNMFFDECLKLGYNPMYGYCDDWNRIAIQINYSNGWKTYNFIKE
jgi:hypothetical protein|tara:strand:+ start:85 stop:612 length:528 start_codon:yes stop_codon:yes gene_type:complete